MGAAWCRHRAEQAHDSKSPFDRVIVRCVDKFYTVDASATPVRLPKPTPGGVNTVSGNEGASEELLKYNSPMRLAGGAGAWQKASLQVPRAEQPLMALPDTSTGHFCGECEDRTPVPPPRRKRASLSTSNASGSAPPRPGVAVRAAPPPRPPSRPVSPPLPAVANKQLLSPPKPRPVNTSTVSLPEWRELQRSDDGEDTTVMPPRRPASASPRPALLRPPSVTSVSDATLERVGTYLRRCRSFGNMSSSGLVDKLSSIDADSDSDVDPWEGVDDFEHTCGPLRGSPPHTPRSRVDRRKISAPGSTRKVSDPERRKRKSGVSATAAPVATSTPAPNEEISTGRFFISSSAEDDWFNREYHRESAPTPPKEPEGEISEVKKELQSIIYNYNRTKKISTSSMNEVLPTQPVRVPKKKKISVASITPPPSPMSSDLEDAVPSSVVINGEEGGDTTSHSTLLRLLRECQTIEGALEDMTSQETDMPSVHHALRKLSKNNHHLKEKEINNQVTQSHDSGLDVRGTLDRSPSAEDKSTIALPATKNADSGVDDDEGQASRTTAAVADTVEKSPQTPVSAEASVKRQHPDASARLDDADDADSSGRSSMTPSLSELEAALSDMLEKSAAADDDERASPLTTEQVHVVLASAAAATLGSDSTAIAAEPVTTTAAMLIPKISVTSDSSPSVH